MSWFIGEDGDIPIWVEAVNQTCTGWPPDWKTLGTNRDSSVGTDLDVGALAPDVRPPRAAWNWAEDGSSLAERGLGSRVWSHGDLAVSFGAVAMEAEVLEERIGGLRCEDRFGREEAGKAALPVKVESLDFALGLGGVGIAEADSVEVKSRSELGEGVRVLGEEEAVTVDVKFQRESVLAKGSGKEVEIGQERIEPAVVVEEPRVGRCVELPEGTEFEGLPATGGGLWAWPWGIMGKVVGQSPPTDAGWIDLELEAAKHLGGDKAVGGGRPGAEELAGECDDRFGPSLRTIATREPGGPTGAGAGGTGAQEGSIELVEAGATDSETLGGKGGGEVSFAEGGQDLADQWRAETVGELAVVLFTARRLTGWGYRVDARTTALRAFPRPPLRYGLLQARRAVDVRL